MSVGAKRRVVGSILSGRKHRMGPTQKFVTLGLTSVAAVCVLAFSGVAQAQTDPSTTILPPATVVPVEPTTTAPLFLAPPSLAPTTVAPTTVVPVASS